MKKLTKDELKNGLHSHLTVGELRAFLNENNLPDDALVLVQRVEDVYYKKHGWSVYEKGDSQYTPAWSCVSFKQDKDLLFLDLHY